MGAKRVHCDRVCVNRAVSASTPRVTRKGIIIGSFSGTMLATRRGRPMHVARGVRKGRLVIAPGNRELISFKRVIANIIRIRIGNRGKRGVIVHRTRILSGSKGFCPRALHRTGSVSAFVYGKRRRVFHPRFAFRKFHCVYIRNVRRFATSRFVTYIARSSVRGANSFGYSGGGMGRLRDGVA